METIERAELSRGLVPFITIGFPAYGGISAYGEKRIKMPIRGKIRDGAIRDLKNIGLTDHSNRGSLPPLTYLFLPSVIISI
jgi:hypothetical protein